MSPARPSRASPEPLFSQHRARIYRQLRRLVRDPGDAEDLTQEVFLRAQRQLDTLRDPAALGPWLRRIATNVCTDFLREASRRRAVMPRAPEEQTEGELAGASGRPGADALLDRARMNACGERFLRRLPDGYRQVLVMHDVMGLTGVEIARRLRCTPGAVKIRLHRARLLFRAELEKGCDFHVDESGALVGGPKPPRR